MSSVPCFSPNGTFLRAYGSCGDSNGNDVCCAAGQTCLSNGLCETDTGGFYSGGCTDKTYASANCPKFCISGTDHFIVSCNGSYCCSGDGSLECCDADSRLPLAVGSSTADAAFVIPVTQASTPTLSSVTPSPTIVQSFTTVYTLSNPSIQSTITPLPAPSDHYKLSGAGLIAVLTISIFGAVVLFVYLAFFAKLGKPVTGLRKWWAEYQRKRHVRALRIQETVANPPSLDQTTISNNTETNGSVPQAIAVELEALKSVFEGLNSVGNRPVELPDTSVSRQEPSSPKFYDGPNDIEMVSNNVGPVPNNVEADPETIYDMLRVQQIEMNKTHDTWYHGGRWWNSIAQFELNQAELQGRPPRPNASEGAVNGINEARTRFANLRTMGYSDDLVTTVSARMDLLYPLADFPLPQSDGAGDAETEPRISGNTIAVTDSTASQTQPPSVTVRPQPVYWSPGVELIVELWTDGMARLQPVRNLQRFGEWIGVRR